ncbi:flavin reductase family protein [Granulicoccus phenolivorans]|uniref:flavin reductase family protein n=1 Tax=Granulicoccus phenolivorans TaxID=266854 RepID=UPI0003F5559A|nr:flavin reductase family protein [Granulicoccus phenolivorans]
MKTEYLVAEMAPKGIYPMLTATVVPRPIAWVTSVSAEGVLNLAPHSFFTVASARPPMIQFTSVGEKDTLRNIRATGEFTVSMVTEPLTEAANVTSVDAPHGVDEYAVAGLTPEPSRLVAPPRVAESPVALECRLHAEIAMGDYFLVIGEVLAWAIDDAVLDAGPRLHPLIQRMRPMSRLGRKEWGTLGEVRELDRPVWSEFGADRG